MTNVEQEIKGNKLVLTINLDEDHGASKSGKTNTVATTHGFQNIEYNGSTIGFSLNVSKRK